MASVGDRSLVHRRLIGLHGSATKKKRKEKKPKPKEEEEEEEGENFILVQISSLNISILGMISSLDIFI